MDSLDLANVNSLAQDRVMYVIIRSTVFGDRTGQRTVTNMAKARFVNW